MSLSSKVWIYQEKKGWIGLFKVLGIADVDITIDMRNNLVTFQNMYMKPYYCHIKDTNISYLETINNLAENLIDKSVNEEIPMPVDCLKPEKPC